MAGDERRRIAHLLRRAGFGASPSELDGYEALGFEASVERLLHPEAIPDDGEADRAYEAAFADLGPPASASLRWIVRMTLGSRPLEEKLAFFWHDHFATSIEKVKSEPLMWRQSDLFRGHGLGRFEDLALEVSRDPAMLIWLDNWESRKDAPNENYGREFLELFTLGLGSYDETDVLAATRAFTGWTLDVDRGEQPAMPEEGDDALTDEQRQRLRREMMQERRDNAEFLFRPDWHDEAEKTFLGETGNWSGEDVVRIATSHPACAAFIVGKLFAAFLWDEPDAATVAPFAENFAASGGDIRETLRALLLSAEFSSDRAYRAKIKTPVEYLVGALRGLQGQTLSRAAFAIVRSMGQVPFVPPHVGGWPSGLAWVGPSATFARANLIRALLGGPEAGPDKTLETLTRIFGDPLPATVEEAVSTVVERVLDGDVTDEQQDALSGYLALGAGGSPAPFDPSSDTYAAKLIGLVRLATSTPAYLLN